MEIRYSLRRKLIWEIFQGNEDLVEGRNSN